MAKKNIRFFLSELIVIIINIICYNLLLNITKNRYIAAIIALFFIILIDYFICLTYVFNNQKFKLINLIKFTILIIIGFLIKKMITNILISSLIYFPNIIIKCIRTSIIIIYHYIVKITIFDNNNLYKKILLYIQKRWNSIVNNKKMEKVFNFVPRNIFLFIFLGISILYTTSFIINNDSQVLYAQPISDENVGPIGSEIINIHFPSNVTIDSYINSICLPFGTYEKETNSTLNVNLLYNNKIIKYDKINTRTLKNNALHCISTPKITKNKINNYHLKVNVTSKKVGDITIFRDKQTKEYTMYLKKAIPFFHYKHLLICIYLIIFLTLSYYINKKGSKLEENRFLLIITIYMFSLLIIYPPLENPDEPSHFFSAYNLSQNTINADKTAEISVPKDIECLNYSSIQNLDRVTNFNKVKSCLENTNNKKTNIMFGVSNKIGRTALGHIPSSIGIKIGDIFTNSSLLIFYTGKLFNFLIGFLIVYYAIKITPKYKILLLLISLNPMFIQQMTSLSYDSLINAVAILFIAYIINKFNTKEKITITNTFIPIIFIVIMWTLKIVYLPLAILLLFIPTEKFKNKKEQILYYLLIIIMSFLGYYLLEKVLFTYNDTSANADIAKQLSYIKSNPLKLIPIAINTFYINGLWYIRGIVGYFSWFRFKLSDFTVYSWIIIFIIIIFSQDKFWNTNKKYQKHIFFLTILISIAGIFGSMYLCWSKYKLNYVDGVQGRYFIPLLPALGILLIPNKKYFKIEKKDVYIYINILLIQYIIYAITFFY